MGHVSSAGHDGRAKDSPCSFFQSACAAMAALDTFATLSFSKRSIAVRPGIRAGERPPVVRRSMLCSPLLLARHRPFACALLPCHACHRRLPTNAWGISTKHRLCGIKRGTETGRLRLEPKPRSTKRRRKAPLDGHGERSRFDGNACLPLQGRGSGCGCESGIGRCMGVE
jgi:hypothetical protein